MDNVRDLAGGSEEWLRRIAADRSRVIVPEHVALALTAAGLAENNDGGVLKVTAGGRAYLEVRGITYVAKPRKLA
jgi:hypothetical protein